ncbi:hypothetical protein M621_20515 [Serratia plymuthica S13]|uniref:Uncharacterized protein n=1 Tax=Serratia plymuthica S13 TaxID=1348660 RepID=S4YPR7_SERPL|nr:hypothetical protein M621_20515 [Serratia plymuthica S13]
MVFFNEIEVVRVEIINLTQDCMLSMRFIFSINHVGIFQLQPELFSQIKSAILRAGCRNLSVNRSTLRVSIVVM